MTVAAPLHVAEIDGHQLRFFRTPNNDGRPDLPWHCVDDLSKVFGLNRQQRRALLQGMQKYDAFRTVATSDGILTIGPHYTAQGAISAIAEIVGDAKSKRIDNAYGGASAEALKKLTTGLQFPSDAWFAWMKAAMNRHEDAGAAS
jgi:hypothetical protein